ncbi:MAG: TOBE domain-containing protein, partial [Reyranellales bacterium]
LFVAQFVGSPIMNVVAGAVRPGDGCTDVVLGEHDAVQRFPVELGLKVTEQQQGRSDLLALGVRPEAVLVALQPADGYFPAEAHIIERLGPYDIVDLKVGAQLFRARTASGHVKKAGDAVWVRLDERQTHFFDQRTGESLRIRL